MGIRQRLNDSRNLGVGIGLAVILVAGILIYRQLAAFSTPAAKIPTRAFYTDDGGKTYFEDDVNKIVPFDHNGKQVYRALVFQCDQGHRFVGVICRHNDWGRQQMTQYLAQDEAARKTTVARRGAIERQGLELKKVGVDMIWIPNDSMASQLWSSLKCPQGHPAQPEPVLPQ